MTDCVLLLSFIYYFRFINKTTWLSSSQADIKTIAVTDQGRVFVLRQTHIRASYLPHTCLIHRWSKITFPHCFLLLWHQQYLSTLLRKNQQMHLFAPTGAFVGLFFNNLPQCTVWDVGLYKNLPTLFEDILRTPTRDFKQYWKVEFLKAGLSRPVHCRTGLVISRYATMSSALRWAVIW